MIGQAVMQPVPVAAKVVGNHAGLGGPQPDAGLAVQAVAAESAAARAGLRAGDRILAVDGLVPRDLIDLQFDLPEARALTVHRGSAGAASAATPVQLSLPPGGINPGDITLTEAVPGGVRECNNHCEFCFIRGLPGGLRRTLYVFDDDYRYSFLWGNFLTLTNLDEADWERIGFQRLSPLNVSVHATDVAVRRKLLNNRHAPAILPQLRRFGMLGVQAHCQVVLSAGVNDGAVLAETVHDLAELYPTVQSVSVVPVGLTRFSRVKNVRRPTADDARATLAECERWQERFRARFGVRFVYPSDELYLLAGQELPPADSYDGFPVLTNGVGMLRAMLDEWDVLVGRRRRKPLARSMVWLAGPLAAPALSAMAERWERFAGWRPVVRVVPNTLFGDQVTVSGLLSGADLLAAVRALPTEIAEVVLPRSAFGFDGRETLDGVAAETIGAAHPGRVHLASTPAELMEIIAQ